MALDAATQADLLAAVELHPVVSSDGQTMEQALNFAVESLLYIARTFNDYDGPIDDDVRAFVRARLAKLTALAPVDEAAES